MLTRKQVLQTIDTSPAFPPLPQNMKSLLGIMHQRSKWDIDLIAELVQNEPALAKTILKSVNSPMAGTQKTIVDPKEAVLMLGIAAVRNLTVYTIVRQFFPAKPLPNQNFDIAKIWKHLVAVALASEMLGKHLGKDSKQTFELFTYGLIHDIGLIVIDACLPKEMDAIEEKMRHMYHAVAERAVLSGHTHTTIGAWVCKKWGLDAITTRIVEFHHSPLMSPVLDDTLRIMYVAEILGGRYYEALSGIPLREKEMDMHIMQSLNISPAKADSIGKILPTAVQEFLSHYAD